MFADDVSMEVIVKSEQGKKRDNSVTPTPERRNANVSNIK